MPSRLARPALLVIVLLSICVERVVGDNSLERLLPKLEVDRGRDMKQLAAQSIELVQTSRQGFAQNGANDDLDRGRELPDTQSTSLSSGSDSDTMGAAYKLSQSNIQLSNFPQEKHKAIKAFRNTVRTEQKKALGESTDKHAPKRQLPKAVSYTTTQSGTRISTDKGSRVGSFGTAVDKLAAQKAKLAKMLESAAAEDMQRPSSQESAFDVQLDNLEASTATDATSLDAVSFDDLTSITS